MPFCKKCGNKLDDQTAFCPKCGTAHEWGGTANKPEEYAKREQVFVGKIRKCPQCGAVLNTDAVTCPECGFDLGVKNVGNAVIEFQNQLRNCDAEIAEHWEDEDLNAPPRRDPFGSVSMFYRPGKYSLKKAALIQSVIIPHNKGEILEFLSIAKGALSIAHPESYWGKIWGNFAFRCVEEGKLYFSEDATFCAKLDSSVINVKKPTQERVMTKSKKVALILSIFLGWFGVDRFYLGSIFLGAFKLATVGGFGFWWLVDIFLIASGSARPANGIAYEEDKPQ